MSKKVLMWLSDSPFLHTGYATISRNILNGLSDEYDIHYLANGYTGQKLEPGIKLEDGTTLKFWIHGNGRSQYFQDNMRGLIEQYRPDFFGVLLDTFMTFPWIQDINFSPAKSLFYYPTDGGGGLPAQCQNVLNHFTYKVAMSKFGQNQVRDVHHMETDYIPHAIDTGIYRPLSDNEKKDARKNLVVVTSYGTKIKGFLQDKYVVGCVARNQPRKMLDLGLKAFAKFCKDKPNSVFYFHSDPFDAATHFDIRQLIERLGITNRVVFSDMKYYDSFPLKEMTKVYNVMDCFFLSTSGEGFGIPIIEAMACEVPVVVTDYTTTPEFIGKDECGICVPVAEELTGSWTVERAIINTTEAAKALSILYSAPDIRKIMGEKGRKKVLGEYDWDKVIPLWKNYLRQRLQ